jgi:hypothetical protein
LSLTDFERRVRHGIYAAWVGAGAPPSAEQQAAALASSVEDVREARRALAAAHALVIDDAAEIRIAHPLSAAPTGFDVSTGDRTFHGNCIWDSLAIPAMLGADASVAASCGDCQEPMEVRIEDGGLVGAELASDARVMHVAVPAAQWWDDVVYTCKTILLFRDDDHVSRWCDGWRITRGAAIPLRQAWRLALAWYGDRMDPAWEPRSRDEANAILRGVGLTGSFWRLD